MSAWHVQIFGAQMWQAERLEWICALCYGAVFSPWPLSLTRHQFVFSSRLRNMSVMIDFTAKYVRIHRYYINCVVAFTTKEKHVS